MSTKQKVKSKKTDKKASERITQLPITSGLKIASIYWDTAENGREAELLNVEINEVENIKYQASVMAHLSYKSSREELFSSAIRARELIADSVRQMQLFVASGYIARASEYKPQLMTQEQYEDALKIHQQELRETPKSIIEIMGVIGWSKLPEEEQDYIYQPDEVMSAYPEVVSEVAREMIELIEQKALPFAKITEREMMLMNVSEEQAFRLDFTGAHWLDATKVSREKRLDSAQKRIETYRKAILRKSKTDELLSLLKELEQAGEFTASFHNRLRFFHATIEELAKAGLADFQNVLDELGSRPDALSSVFTRNHVAIIQSTDENYRLIDEQGYYLDATQQILDAIFTKLTTPHFSSSISRAGSIEDALLTIEYAYSCLLALQKITEHLSELFAVELKQVEPYISSLKGAIGIYNGNRKEIELLQRTPFGSTITGGWILEYREINPEALEPDEQTYNILDARLSGYLGENWKEGEIELTQAMINRVITSRAWQELQQAGLSRSESSEQDEKEGGAQ